MPLGQALATNDSKAFWKFTIVKWNLADKMKEYEHRSASLGESVAI